jgi:hypothetical protein
MEYYARYAPTISGVGYALLAGRQLSKSERMLMTKLSSAAPLFDDYFDDDSLSPERLKLFITQPEKVKPGNTKEELFLKLLLEIKAEAKQYDYFNEVCLKVYESQMMAKEQQHGELAYDDLHKISFDKGGYSTLLFKSIMDEPSKPGENNAIWHFGGMVQWVDDMFDIYEDTINHIQTFATPKVDIKITRQNFLHDLQEMISLFKKLTFPSKRIWQFLDFQVFFFSRTMVCFEQLEKIQGDSEFLEPGIFIRKALICDMEKWENILKWFRYYKKMRSTLLADF